MIETVEYARKPFYVDAVQVTAENMHDVAKWCEGQVQTSHKNEGHNEQQYVKVRVHRPLNERQTKAYVGDWVLYAGTGYKVYTTKAFQHSFERAEGEAEAEVLDVSPTSQVEVIPAEAGIEKQDPLPTAPEDEDEDKPDTT